MAVAAAAGATKAVTIAVGSLVLSAGATAANVAGVAVARRTAGRTGVAASADAGASADVALVLLSERATLAPAVTSREVIGAASTGRTVRGSVVGAVVVEVSMSAAVSETVVDAVLLAELNTAAVLAAATFADTWKAVAAGFG
ncbi:hypothetical protein [Rhizobium sp. 16-449-1b]|uniref:hypothetical protein n=1 Tax=Rhizobium sp. 16-449-1b TaxID=2819989 RepID=UPI0032AF1076